MDISWALTHNVDWSTQTGELDAYAKPIYKPMGSIPARVNRKVQIVKNADGEEIVSDTQVHVIAPVLMGDQLTISGKKRKILAIDDGQALYGAQPSFFVLYL